MEANIAEKATTLTISAVMRLYNYGLECCNSLTGIECEKNGPGLHLARLLATRPLPLVIKSSHVTYDVANDEQVTNLFSQNGYWISAVLNNTVFTFLCNHFYCSAVVPREFCSNSP